MVIGIASAALPTIANGTAGYHDTLTRLIEGGAALALTAAWSLGYHEHSPTAIAARTRFGGSHHHGH